MIQRPWYRSPLLVLLAFFLLQWLLLFSLKEPTWDAVSYYVYARSAVFDGDLQFENDYQLSYPTAGEHFASKELDQVTTPTARVANLFAIGTALWWLPWLVVLRAGAPVFLSSAAALTGYERFFVSNLATLSALFGFLAILLSYRVAQGAINRRLALFSAITLMFATPLIFYQFREPMYSHTTSALAVALCVFVWWKQHERMGSGWHALGLGALIGLAGLVRWQNLAYLLLPLSSILILWLQEPNRKSRQVWGRALWIIFLTGVGALAVFSLQAAVWRVLYGSFVTIPQGNTFIDWRAPFTIPFLFSSFRGVLPWMPLFFLALAGLLMLSKRNVRLGLPLLLMLLLAVYINGSTRDWFAGAGFGPRRLTSELVIFVVGYAVFLQLMPVRIRTWGAVLIGVGLALHQWTLLRFGLPERLGGRVMSMAPTFEWEEVPLTQFAAELAALLIEAGKRPLDFLIFYGSALDTAVRQNSVPVQHLGTLLATSLFLLLVVGGLIFLSKRNFVKNHPIWVLIFAVLVLGLSNLWIIAGS